jgi:hypothetical protein
LSMGAEELRRYQLYLRHEKKLALGTAENCSRPCGSSKWQSWLERFVIASL